MRDNVRSFIELASRVFDPPGPVVEVGAYQTTGQEGYADLRPFFPGREYIGIDAEAGPGVDRVEDVHALGFDTASIGAIVCADTLEHVADPARAIAEMRRVLRPGGVLMVSMPFAFPIHYMPDYVRYTPEGLSRLLAAFDQRVVFGHGDAQNPHTVNGVARAEGGGDQSEFARLADRLEQEWNSLPLIEALLRFEPLTSVLRRAGWPARTTGRGRVLEQRLVCPRDGVARIDVLLGSDGAPLPMRWRLQVLDEAGALLAESAWVLTSGDQRWVAFTFTAGVGRAGQPLRLRLEPFDRSGDATAFVHDTPDARLEVDGVPVAGALCVELFCRRQS